MAAAVGSLAVNIVANTAQFTQGIQHVRAQIAGFSTIINATTNSLGGFVTKMAGVVGISLGVSAAIQQVSNSIEYLGSISDQSKALGMSGDSLLGLHYAAEQSNSSIEGLGTALNKMVKNLGAAISGSDKANQAFADIGLSAGALAAMSPDQAFGQIADAINRLPTVAERSVAAVNIFGKAGQDLLPMLAMGSAGLDDLGSEWIRLNGSISDSELATVEALGDALKRLAVEVVGLVHQMVVRLAPAMLELAATGQQLFEWWQKLGGETQQNIIKMTAYGVAIIGVLAIVPRIVSALGSIVKTLRAVAAGQAIVQALSGPKGWITLAASVAAAAGAIHGIDRAFESLNQSIASAQEAAGTAAGSGIKEAREAAAEAADETKRLADEMKQLESRADSIREGVRTPLEVAQEGIAEVQRLLELDLVTLDTYQRQVAKIGSEYLDATKEAKKLKDIEKQSGVGAVTRGTTAGFSAVQDAARAQAAMMAQAKQQTQEQKRTNELLGVLIETTKESSAGAAVVLKEVQSI
jgi:methyl-accepting chemotaxis protein